MVAGGAKQAGGATVTLKEYTMGLIDGLQRAQDIQMVSLKEMLRTQFELQEKAGQQRYDAQEKAGAVAFTAQQTALTTGLLTAERGVETALAAAKEATTKAEVNATARFEQFRSESGLQLKTLSDKLDTEIGRVSEKINELTNRLDLSIGRGVGATDARTNARLDTGQLLTVVSLVIAFVAVASRLITG